MIFLTKLILEAIRKLGCGKSAGPDSDFCKTNKFAQPRLHTLLYFCFDLYVTHGYNNNNNNNNNNLLFQITVHMDKKIFICMIKYRLKV